MFTTVYEFVTIQPSQKRQAPIMRTYKAGPIKLYLFPIANEWLFVREENGRAREIESFESTESAALKYSTEVLNNQPQKAIAC